MENLDTIQPTEKTVEITLDPTQTPKVVTLAPVKGQNPKKEKRTYTLVKSSYSGSLATPPRNKPCPCGSGKKYKFCCRPK